MSSQKMSFFEWVAECCKLRGLPKRDGQYMMPEVDPCWYGAYDDGLTPEDAVTKYNKYAEEIKNEI